MQISPGVALKTKLNEHKTGPLRTKEELVKLLAGRHTALNRPSNWRSS